MLMHRLAKLIPAAGALLLVFASVMPVFADGIIIPPWPIDPPGPDLAPVWLTIEYHHVDVTIENQIATTRVDQVFYNQTDRTAEGTYLFPLPVEATVEDFVMWVDGKPIEPQILEAEEAREIYNDIVRQMRDPALLEYVGMNAVQANVFPIGPGEERRIELQYSQVLPVDQGMVHYVYPLNTEKFSARPLEDVSVTVDVVSNDSINAIYSPSHKVDVVRDGTKAFRAGYEAKDVLPDTDFSLYYTLADDEIDVNMISYKESAGEDGFFMLLVAPSVEVAPSEIVAKDVIVVLDQSGSMEGEKWEQARDAVRFVLEQLNENDRFNVILFSTGARLYAREMQPRSEREDAVDWIMGEQAIGGTNINEALTNAALMVGERPATILFLTDGLATEGIMDTPSILENVADALPKNARIFTFGVGDDVDTILLDTLVQNHRGAGAYVRPGERIDEEVNALYAKISAPVLTDIAFDFGSVMAEDMHPDPLPDLFAGTQFVLVGRYREGGTTNITLTGTVNGEERTFTYSNVEFRERAGGGSDFIPRLWATRRIGYLLQQIRLYGENQELIDSIVTLSVRYGIITPYTSFLIREDDIFTEEGRGRIMEDADDIVPMSAERGGGTGSGVVSGADAVDEAEAIQDLGAAEAPMARPTMTMNKSADFEAGEFDFRSPEITPIQYRGTHTFKWVDDVWVDTLFNPDEMTPEKIVYMSDAYFDLIAKFPELGDYFSLGVHVIAVHEGVAYQVVTE